LELDLRNSQYEEQANIRAAAFEREQAALKQQYAQDLAACGDNEAAKAAIQAKYEQDTAKLAEKYAVETAQAQVDNINKLLKNENLTATQREDLAKQLAAAQTALANAEADAEIAAIERVTEADAESKARRMQSTEEWLQKAAEALSAINDLASAIYDGKIQQIENEQDALDEASEEEIDRITNLVDTGVITEEEGEARKRAAEEKTAKKTEELEKKKAELEYKQAVWDKANSIAQCGISTALAITKALPNVVLAAICGAMGAIQLATILATPIPKYAKGTDYHKGGLALVGDAGKQEVVTYGDEIWLTPDKPTLVDLPKGASVASSIAEYISENPVSPYVGELSTGAAPIIVNDYHRLEAKLEGVNNRMDSIIYRLKKSEQFEKQNATNQYLNFISATRL
jgi:hypothetical protein